MSETLIRVDNVSKIFCRDLKKSLWYGLKDIGGELLGRKQSKISLREKEFWALKDISFSLKRGEALGLIGHNGAGKTTLLKLLNGLIKPDSGRISIRGKVGALIALGAGFNPILTGRENVYVNGSILGLSKKEIDRKLDEIVEFSELEEFIDAPVQSYSSGMQVRLGFAVATSINPDILLVDEVLAVGDLGFQSKCINRISKLLDSSAVIFVSHAMMNVVRMTNKILLLNGGSIDFFGNDVSEGVDRYYNLFDKEKLQVVGGENVDLSYFKILDFDKKKPVEISSINYNQEYQIEIKINILTPIKYFIVNLIYVDSSLKYIGGITSLESGTYYKNQKQPTKIRLKLRNMLTAGSFTLNLSFTEYKLKNHSLGEGIALFKSIKSINSRGAKTQSGQYPVLFEGSWFGDELKK